MAAQDLPKSDEAPSAAPPAPCEAEARSEAETTPGTDVTGEAEAVDRPAPAPQPAAAPGESPAVPAAGCEPAAPAGEPAPAAGGENAEPASEPVPPAPAAAPESAPAASGENPEEAGSPEFARALADFERSVQSAAAAVRAASEPSVGTKVKGTVLSVGDQYTIVDFGGRSEGVVETRHFMTPEGKLRVGVGDDLDLFVVQAGDQVVLAPSIRSSGRAALRQMREAQQAGVPVTGRVTGLNAGGLAVDLGGARGFCPVSQIEAGFCADPSTYVGRTLEFLVVQVEEHRRSVVLSRRKLLRRAEEEQALQLVAELKPGDEREGTVSRLEPFGAFVDLGGVDGLVHVSEVRHERLNHPREALKEGEKVRVRVLRIKPAKDGRPRIALSIKAVRPDPWHDVETRFPVGSRVTGKVARIADFGAFVNLAPGIDGLVHVSEAALHRVAHVKEALEPGQSIEAVVLSVDAAKKRISLSVREALADSLPPPRTPAAGEETDGFVAGIKPFGVFVDLPEYGARTSGLLPREETGEPRGTDLSAIYTVGQPLHVRILEVKGDRIRVSVGRPKRAPRGRSSAPAKPSAPRHQEEPMTTMAIALRKAMEEARKREQGRDEG